MKKCWKIFNYVMWRNFLQPSAENFCQISSLRQKFSAAIREISEKFVTIYVKKFSSAIWRKFLLNFLLRAEIISEYPQKILSNLLQNTENSCEICNQALKSLFTTKVREFSLKIFCQILQPKKFSGNAVPTFPVLFHLWP